MGRPVRVLGVDCLEIRDYLYVSVSETERYSMPDPAATAAGAFQHAFTSRDFASAAAVLAEDVVFRSPVLHEHWRTRPVLERLGPAMVSIFDTIEFGPLAALGDRALLPFTGRLGATELEGIQLLDTGPDGLVAEFAIFIRPLGALQAVAAAMGAALGR
jgi:hypothetical protein